MQTLTAFSVTSRMHSAHGLASGLTCVLPMDSPDAEHACASTLANAASLVRKIKDKKAMPVALCAVDVHERG